METPNVHVADHVPLYAALWLIDTLVFVILRLIISSESTANAGGSIFTAYAVSTMGALIVVNLYEGLRVRVRLWKHQKLNLLTLILWFFRLGPSLLSQEDFGDLTLRQLKINYRRFLRFLVLAIFSTALVTVILLAL